MKITLDGDGAAIPDVKVESFVKTSISNGWDIHTSNNLVIDWVRAVLFELPKEKRPIVDWTFYGKEVHFDDSLRSYDAYNDSRTDIAMRALNIIMG